MSLRAGMRYVLWAAFLLSMGCQSDPSGPDGPGRDEPRLQAVPEPGTYERLQLDVSIGVASSGWTFYYGLNEEPVVSPSLAHAGGFSVRLLRSTNIRVLAEDEHGHLWGPYSFQYELTGGKSQGSCVVHRPTRTWYQPGEPISLTIDYAVVSGTSSVELLIDGQEYASLVTMPESAAGTVHTTVSSLTDEHEYLVSCQVSRPDVSPLRGSSIRIGIDGTAPDLSWLSSGGLYRRHNWPGSFRLEATDAGAGVAFVEACSEDALFCYPLRRLAGDTYLFGTALTTGTEAVFQVYLRAVDHAGNEAFGAPLSIDLADFSEPVAPAPLPITFSVETGSDPYVVDLPGFVGDAIAQVRTLGGTELSPTALPLMDGWNDFVFRRADQGGWESFGVYGAGARITLPDLADTEKHWLVFVSRSRIPGYQLEKIGTLPSTHSVYHFSEFEVPHLWFVFTGNETWDAGDRVFRVTGDDYSSPWLSFHQPVAGDLTEVSLIPGEQTRTVTITCTLCEPDGTLYLQRRVDPWGDPVSHASMPSIDFSVDTTVIASVEVDDTDVCDYFWDETGDGALSGREPRAHVPCDATEVYLSDRAGGMEAVLESSRTVLLQGVPYADIVTGVLTVGPEESPLYREALPPVGDIDGRGTTSILLPEAAYLGAKATFYADDAVTSVTTASHTNDGDVAYDIIVHDAAGQSVMAAIAVSRGDVVRGGIHDPAQGPLRVTLPPSDDAPFVIPYCEGALGQGGLVSTTLVTVYCLAPDGETVGQISGRVTDTTGAGVPHLNVRWELDAYVAQVLTEADGTFAIPATSSGVLSIRRPGQNTEALSVGFTLSPGEYIEDVALQVEESTARRVPRGLVTAMGVPSLVDGQTPVFSDDTYWSAQLPAGLHRAQIQSVVREFSMPGAFPTLSIPQSTFLPYPGDLALTGLPATLRCGARMQSVSSEVVPWSDSPCWHWFVDDGLQTYSLGAVTPGSGFPPSFLGTWKATVRESGSLVGDRSLLLRDRILGRIIDVKTDAGGSIETSLPHGVYSLETLAGTRLLDSRGNEAVIRITGDATASLRFDIPE